MRLLALATSGALLWANAACAQNNTVAIGGRPEQDFVLTIDQSFKSVDTNHDEVVTIDEAQRFHNQQWALLDPDGSGVVTAKKVGDVPQASNILGRTPAAADGSVSKKDFDRYWRDQFRTWDLHHDGALDSVLFRAYEGAGFGDTHQAKLPEPSYSMLADPFQAGLPTCEELAKDARFGLFGADGVSKVSAARIPARGGSAAYCAVELTYNSGKSGPKDGYDDGQAQAIGIRVGLPLRPDDGGTTKPWNGRIKNLGSGGCMGFMPGVTAATDHGFVGSANDGGHKATQSGFDCSFGVIQARHIPNKGLIRDFSDNVVEQTLWAKNLTQAYYGQKAKRTYWCGCSQGGRQAAAILQLIPNEYDGVLGGGAALDWMRLPIAQAWPGLVIKDMLRANGKDLTPGEILQTVKLEVKACDANDGVVDGVLADPRQCHWSAKVAICGTPGAAAHDCLDSDQAAAFDAIRRGPVNHLGQQISYPWEPGTIVSSGVNYFAADPILQWAVGDRLFISESHLYIDREALVRARDPMGITVEDMVTLASQTVGDLPNTNSVALDAAAKSGVKAILWSGTRDKNIPSRVTLEYYQNVATHLGMSVDDPRLQAWLRVFLYPGVAHCGGEDAPQPGDISNGPLFQALLEWVEQGRQPERIIATTANETDGMKVTRPVCPYPQTATYNGKGSTDDASNFTCGGNLETGKTAQLIDAAKANGTGVVPAVYRSLGRPN